MLTNKRCLVTGGSRNLGRALCVGLAEAGAKVAFTYLSRDADAERTLETLRELGAEPLAFKGDASDPAHVKETIKALNEAWGGLDVLVNNVGISKILPIALLEEADWDKMMAVNVKSAYLFSREALRGMLKQRSGRIISIGSFASRRIIGAPVHYAASKAALEAFTLALAHEVGKYDVLVNCVSPGLADVGMSQRLPAHHVTDFMSQAATGQLVPGADVAATVVWLASDANTSVTGARIEVDGGV